MSDDTARAYAAAVECVARCATDIANGLPPEMMRTFVRRHVRDLEAAAADGTRPDCAIAAQIIGHYVEYLGRFVRDEH